MNAPVLLAALLLRPSADAPRKPNVVVLLADDMGYGDPSCYNPKRGKIATPNLDRLARAGMRFTDAHSSSGVCSPSRYSLLTGRYHWRTRLQKGIVNVWGKPLIAAGRLTLAGLAKKHGYHTACVGKWHLGWDWPIPEEQRKHFRDFGGKAGGGGKAVLKPTDEQVAAWKAVFARRIPGGPTSRGFDEYFGTDVPNWPPYCLIENDRTVGIPSTLLPAEALVKNQASIQGPALPGWKLDAVLPALADRACSIIHKQAKAGKPLFLYLPLTAPHTPIAVAKEWQGKSKIHPYADFVMQTDAVVGRVLAAIDKAGIARNTLVVFTSDNGCAGYIGVKDIEAKGHFPSGPLRGYKADAWEGGHRVPFIVRWPGKVKAGSVCDQTICSVDLMATFADILGAKLPADAGEDSVSLMPLLRGVEKPIHEAVVHQSSSGIFAVRFDKYKVILGPPSGGPKDVDPHVYDIHDDIGETKNHWAGIPGAHFRADLLIKRYIADGRSTPGPKQKNDVPIQLIKPAPKAKEEKPAGPKLVTYREASGAKLQLHVFAPPGLKAGDKRTAIVFFFGGGWKSGNPKQFYPFARHFAAKGCVAICPEYRVESRDKTTPADAVRDAKMAIRYVRTHAKELGVGPHRIVASGGSAGGHLAAAAAVVPGFLDEKGVKDADVSPNALVLFNPALNTSAEGLPARKGADSMKPISPQHHVRAGLPPTIIFHGTADKSVPFKQATEFRDAMRKAKNTCDVEAFEGRGHGFFNSPEVRKANKPDDYEACLKRMTLFLEDHKFLPAVRSESPEK